MGHTMGFLAHCYNRIRNSQNLLKFYLQLTEDFLLFWVAQDHMPVLWAWPVVYNIFSHHK